MSHIKDSSIADCRLLPLPSYDSSMGNLVAINALVDIPFEVKRVYYIFDVPPGASRGNHAHKEMHQVLIPIRGRMTLHVDDGEAKKTFELDDPKMGVYIPPGIWRTLDHFSGDAMCLSLSSSSYDKDEYISDYDEFLGLRKHDSMGG